MMARILRRIGITVSGLASEVAGGARLAADPTSFLTFARDVFAYRLMRVAGVEGRSARRSVSFRAGAEISYRLDRGDIRGIAETWVDHAYELPGDVRFRNVLDLGANIGSTAVWFAQHYGCDRLVALEPVPGNATVLRDNLERNGIDAEVVEAAVGLEEGVAFFQTEGTSTLGRLADSGMEVRVVTPQSLVDRFPADEPVDLVKMDIEGAERDILAGDLTWLDRVGCMVVEFHHGAAAAEPFIDNVVACGFTHTDLSKPSYYAGVDDRLAFFRRADRSLPSGGADDA